MDREREGGARPGAGAIRHWVRGHWHTFVRNRWVEHLEGRIFWVELDRGDFGLLRRECPDAALIGEIVRRIKNGEENLDILCWSHERKSSKDEIQKILGILEMLDINGHRIECRLKSALSQAG